MGYYLNNQYFADLADTVGLDLNFFPLDAIEKNPTLSAVYARLLADPMDNINLVNNKIAYGYIMLRDISNKPVGFIQIKVPRIIFQEGLSLSHHFFFIVVTLGLFVILLTWLLLKIFVLSRVLSISKQVQNISRENKFDKKIKFHGNDELASMVVSINSMMQIINTSQSQLRYVATHDSLTDLPNRELFYTLLTQAIIDADRAGSKIAVFYLDMDKFKQVNDAHGHDVGDKLLQLIAKRIRHTVRANDVAARQAGDEFIIFMSHITDLTDVNTFAEKLLTIGATPFVINDHEIRAVFSIGISIYPDDARTIEELFRHADEAMYTAKRVAVNAYRIYEKKVTLDME